MPVTTLQNLSVPFDGEANSSLLMPKLQYRFRVTFDRFGADVDDSMKVLQRQVVDVTRPNLSFEKMTLDAYNSRTYLAGKHTWDPITLTLREDASNNVQRSIGSQLQKQFDFFEQASAASGGDYKFHTKIEILDGGNANKDPIVLDRFELKGCFIESANYNTLAYATSEAVTVTLSIQYDNAVQLGTNAGAYVGVGQVTEDVRGTNSTG